MNKKRFAAIAVALALALVLSLSASVFALNDVSISDVIGIINNVDLGAFPSYNETSWNALTIAERRSALENATSAFKGSPHYDDDFLNTSQAFDYYHNLIKSGNSVNFVSAPVQSMYGQIMLERAGQADFGLGFYKSDNHHGGGGAGGRRDTVADTLNDDFLDYVRDNPQNSDSSVVNYIFENGCSASLYVKYVNRLSYDTWTWCLRLVDSHGNVVFNDDEIQYTSRVHYGWIKCDYESDAARALSKFYFDNGFLYTYTLDGRLMEAVNLQDYLLSPCFVDDNSMPAAGTDENGNQIQFNINSDGVTYDGNTYNYNDDNSVTINGNTYYITVNPADVNEDYYNQFLQQVINNYYNYYNTDSTPFDGSEILTAIKSVFTSLETFRSYCYSQLKQIYNSMVDGFNALRSSVRTLGKKLDTIIDLLKNINDNVETITEEQEEKNKSDWADLISDFKDKVGWASLDKSVHNIQTAFFGQREYSVHSETGEIQVQILQKDAAPLASSMPNLSIIYMGQSFNLYSCVAYLGGIEPIKQFISLFLWVGFILSAFRSIPSILGGVASLQDHSNTVVVDKRTGDVKRGA